MDDASWGDVIDAGLTALLVPEADGGLGLGASELCIVVEELGKGLLAGAFVYTSLVPALLISAAGDGPVRESLLERIVAGDRRIALADSEHGSRGVWDNIVTAARPEGEVYVLNGGKTNVCISAGTLSLLVTARVADRVGLFVVPMDSDGVQVRAFDTLDQGRAADASFSDVKINAEGYLPLSGSARDEAWDLALLAVVAECIGHMKTLQRLTADYISERKQFGQPLSRFQALRHRMADMALARMAAEALMARVATQFAALSAGERRQLVAAACAKALGGARYVAEQAVHLHGGMGVTEEVVVGRYLRRLLALETMCGPVSYFRAQFGKAASAAP